MSNHYHLVVRTDPTRTADWSAEEVARRWLSRNGAISKAKLGEKIAELITHPNTIQILRARLASLSWFMRGVNEPLARMANAEDDCTGRFWEGRFKSVALLDRSAIINCMVYVELNPARANPRQKIPSEQTSALLRTNSRKSSLMSLSELDLTLSSYLRLIEWTHDCKNKNAPRTVLANIGQSETQWLKSVQAHSAKYRAYGLPDAINQYLKKLNQHWIQMPAFRSPEFHPE